MVGNIPSPPTHSTSNILLLSILSKDKLTGPNYLDWIRALRIALRYEDKEYLLDEDLPILNDDASPEAEAEYNKQDTESRKVACLMLASLSPELQNSFENMGAFETNEQLREMFQEQATQERFQVVKSLMDCKHQDSTSVCTHVQKMKAYIDRLGNLGVNLPTELAIDIVLNSLSGAYKQFIVNFNMNNMNNMDKTLMELHGMLKTVEASMGKTQSTRSTAPSWPLGKVAVRRRKFLIPKGRERLK